MPLLNEEAIKFCAELNDERIVRERLLLQIESIKLLYLLVSQEGFPILQTEEAKKLIKIINEEIPVVSPICTK